MQLSEFVEFYGRDRDIAPATWADYRWVSKAFESWHDRPVSLDDLTARLITDYLCWMIDQGRKPATLRSRRTKLIVLWKAAFDGGYTNNPPDTRVRRIRVPAPNPRGITPEEAAALIRWCQSNMRRRMRLVPVAAGDYLAALFAFLWDSGMRLGDAISMEYAWLSPTIVWRQSKTGIWHKAHLTPETLDYIERIRTARALIWPRPGKSRTALYKLIKRAFAGVGIDGSSKLLRQGVATNVYVNGEDPGKALGHVPGSRVAIRHYVRQDVQIATVSPTALFYPGTAPQGI